MGRFAHVPLVSPQPPQPLPRYRLARVLARLAALAVVAAAFVLPASAAHAALSNPPKGTTIRAVEAVNLRTGPSTSYSIITTVYPAYTATVLDPNPQNGFYYVNYQGRRGWTHGAYWNAVSGIWANGYQLTANEDANVRWIARNTMPRIEGTRSERLTKASRVTWWTLKEGVLGLANPHPYSNCDNVHIDPVANCYPTCCWQIGIAAVQEGNYSLTSTEATAVRLYPGSTVQQVLAHTATYSGYPSGTYGYDRIVNSTGDFRNSWLLRNHGVGFTHQAPTVYAECVSGSYSWCYGTGWNTTARYAPTKSAALRVIAELNATLDGLAP
jgi:hypothetical protein